MFSCFLFYILQYFLNISETNIYMCLKSTWSICFGIVMQHHTNRWQCPQTVIDNSTPKLIMGMKSILQYFVPPVKTQEGSFSMWGLLLVQPSVTHTSRCIPDLTRDI